MPEPTPEEGAETLLHQRPQLPPGRGRDFADLLRARTSSQPESPPAPAEPDSGPLPEIELSDPQVYTLTDADLPPIPRTLDEEPEPPPADSGPLGVEDELDADLPHTAPSTPSAEDLGGYDEVFPLRSDPRLALPPPPASSNRDETNSLLRSTGDLGRRAAQPSGPAGPDPDEPGTQWVPRARTIPAPPPNPPRKVIPEEHTDVRGFGPPPLVTEDDDDAPTVIMPPPSGLGDTPPGEQRADEVPPPPGPDVTVPAIQPTVRLTRPDRPTGPPPQQGVSAAALAASSLGIVLLVLVLGVGALVLLRWAGVW